jgi:sugar lactone lactonase YvrE
MHIFRFALSGVVAATLAACGGGGADGAQTATPLSGVNTTIPGVAAPVTVPATPLVQLAPGSSHTMLAGETVLVPAGAVVTTTDNSTVTVNGHSNTVNVSAGARVVVPATASGAADNMVVAAGASPQYALTLQAQLLAGGGAIGDSAVVDGAGAQARFDGISQLALDSNGNLYASGRNAVRRITPDGYVSTVTGAVSVSGLAVGGGDILYGSGSFDGALYRGSVDGGLKPWLTGSFGGGRLAADGSGNVYLADFTGKRILKVDANGTMSVLVGAGLHGPSVLVLDRSGTLLVDDSDRVLKVRADGSVQTLAAVPQRIIASDGAMAVDAAGNVYVATDNDIRWITPDGSINLVRLSSGSTPYIMAMAALPSGGLYIGTGWAAPSQIWKLKL